MAVSGSVSLLLALVGAASADGAWCALVGFPRISAEAADEYGVDLRRLAVVPSPGSTVATWTTAVGALLDAVDIVAARPPRLVPGDVRRLAARARSRDAVLMPYGDWPGADVRVRAVHGSWDGIGTGTGRLQARRITVDTDGKGPAARPRHADLWLPARGGGIEPVLPLAPVVDLAGRLKPLGARVRTRDRRGLYRRMPNFESFHKGLVPQRSQPLVTLQKRGAISLNRAAYQALGEPKAVELLYDRDASIIGLRPADITIENAYAVRPATTAAGPYLVSAMAFTRFYAIDTGITRRRPAYVENGVLCIDLTAPSDG